MQTTQISTELAQDIINGLTADPKYIPSKYFYDAIGSDLFSKIMRMPEYYLTNAEAEIFEIHKSSIVDRFCNSCKSIDIVELGAGDGTKTRILINYMLTNDIQFRYIPVDISKEANRRLEKKMHDQFEGIQIESKTGDYFDMIHELGQSYQDEKIVMFLGSNLGNYPRTESIDFLQKLAGSMKENDKLFLGLDLKKDPEIIRQAYNDAQGYTRSFNMNLFERMNRELGANFDIGNFIHSPAYDPLTGTAKSYLVSKKRQEVFLKAADKKIMFDKWEAVYTEMSQKYDLRMIEEIASASGFEVEENYFDSRSYFVNTLWKKKQM